MKQLTFLLTFFFTLFIPTSIQAQTTEFWGMTSQGGTNNTGVIFKTDANFQNLQVIHQWSEFEGDTPNGSLLQANDGKLYGLTFFDTQNHNGVLFSYDYTTGTYTKKFQFDGTNGRNPYAPLIQATNGKLYGVTTQGGANDKGVIFEYDLTTDTFRKIFDFDGNSNGARPYSALLQASNGKLYGMTLEGGANNFGVLFEYDLTTDTYRKILDFDGNSNGAKPYGSLLQASNGKLYGLTRDGGTNDFGVIFEYDPTTDTYTKLHDFDGINGKKPSGSLIQLSNGKLYGITREGGANDDGVIFEYDLSTQVYTKKMDFDLFNSGRWPNDALLEASNGKLYGITILGGVNNDGVIFEFDPVTGIYTKKFDFDEFRTGNRPFGKLIQASNGKLYGMTGDGGIFSDGNLFEFDITTNQYTQKFSFGETTGDLPYSSLFYANNGKLYGTTNMGGPYNKGILFEIDPVTNVYTTKIIFNGSNGAYPTGTFIQGTNGKLYGTTAAGGTYNDGILFEYDLQHDTLIALFEFDGVSGRAPDGSLLKATNGKIYGTTSSGGLHGLGVLFEFDPATNSYTKKFDFDYNTGENPFGSLVQTNAGKLYGLTYDGGSHYAGVLFEFDPATNTYTKKYEFDGDNGTYPKNALTLASNGKLYGVTARGGIYDKGVLFEFDPVTNTYTKKFDFNNNDGRYANGNLIQASNGKLYGLTIQGGAHDKGVIFEYDITTNTYIKKFEFNGTNGKFPNGYNALTEILSAVSVEQMDKKNISLIPNPTSNSIKINMDEKPIKITILNIKGQTLYETNQTNKEMSINMSDYAQGIYLIKIQTNEGTTTLKIIKK